jgi:Ca2+-binding EF-hand superfamily protein
MAERIQTRDQVVAKVRDHFARLDTNRDGFLTTAEIEAMRGQHKMGQWMRPDGRRMAMRTGPVGDPNAIFDRLDSNRDGMISRDEFAKGRELRVERKIVMNGAPGAPGSMLDGHHPGMMMMHRMGGMMRGHMLKTADLNKDGRVSLQEATTSALQHFDQADANRDGRITPDERRSMHLRMMQEHGRNAG